MRKNALELQEKLDAEMKAHKHTIKVFNKQIEVIAQVKVTIQELREATKKQR